MNYFAPLVAILFAHAVHAEAPASSDATYAGQWKGSIIIGAPPNWNAEKCPIIPFNDYFVSFEVADDDSRVLIGSLLQGTSLISSTRAECTIPMAKRQFVSAQFKSWDIKGLIANDETLEVKATNGQCNSESDFCDKSPFPEYVKPGATSWSGRFYLRGGVLYDDIGSPEVRMHIPMVPLKVWNQEAERGATTAYDMAKIITNGHCGDIEPLVTSLVTNGGSSEQLIERCTDFQSNAGAVQTFSETGRYYFPPMQDKGSKQNWMVQYLVRTKRGTGSMVIWLTDDAGELRLYSFAML